MYQLAAEEERFCYSMLAFQPVKQTLEQLGCLKNIFEMCQSCNSQIKDVRPGKQQIVQYVPVMPYFRTLPSTATITTRQVAAELAGKKTTSKPINDDQCVVIF